MADAAAIAKANEPVPDMVKQFVAYFYRHIREKNVYETLSMYEKSFGAISERYFKASAWPSVEAIAKYADDDHVFCLLYKEMYFRHVYGKATPTLEQRRESWDNYANLFSVITHGNVNMQLPNLWLWEMIDEFIYQFQSFCQFRGKLSGKTKEELKALDECDAKGVWAADAVLNFLAQMVERSGIAAALEAERAGTMKFSETEGYDYAASNVLRTLGYFSLIGTARVRILLGGLHHRAQGSRPDRPRRARFVHESRGRVGVHGVPRRVRVLHARAVHGCRSALQPIAGVREQAQGGGERGPTRSTCCSRSRSRCTPPAPWR